MSEAEIRRAEYEAKESAIHLERALDKLVEKATPLAEAARHPGSTMSGMVSDYVGSRKQSAVESFGRFRDSASDRLSLMTQSARSQLQVVSRTASERPVAMGAGTFAVGALAGYLLGSVLVPKKPGMQAIFQFIDKCTARWAFERTGVRLYDEAILKCPIELRSRLIEIRNEEKSHEEALEEIIRGYGADPHATTHSTRLTRIESEGIVSVVENDDYPGVIDALLAAELVDNANWDLLARLARKIGDRKARKLCLEAQAQEAKHLLFIRELVLQDNLKRVG